MKEKIEPVFLAALDPALSFQKLILHCITAINKSLKCLAIITEKKKMRQVTGLIAQFV